MMLIFAVPAHIQAAWTITCQGSLLGEKLAHVLRAQDSLPHLEECPKNCEVLTEVKVFIQIVKCKSEYRIRECQYH